MIKGPSMQSSPIMHYNPYLYFEVFIFLGSGFGTHRASTICWAHS